MILTFKIKIFIYIIIIKVKKSNPGNKDIQGKVVFR